MITYLQTSCFLAKFVILNECNLCESSRAKEFLCVGGWLWMGTETWYLIGLGAKLWKTGVLISSDVNGSVIGTGEIKKTHKHLLLLYIHIILQILSHQSHQLFLYAIIFKLLSMMHFCYSQFRSEIALTWRSFSTRNMKALFMIEERTNY